MARLEIKWLPAVGAARYEVREQGLGNTPIERFQSGMPLGPRVDSTRFVFTAAELRPYNISVRAYNRSGVASREPTELTVSVGLNAQGSRLPTDIDLVMYLSMDEHIDQNGDLVEPQIFPDGTLPVMPPGSAEQRRRMRWDQGYAENHMVIATSKIAPGSSGGITGTHATSQKSSPSNHHVEFGDTTAGTPFGRTQIFGHIYMLVDTRAGGATGGQTDVDFLDNFTLLGWVNPCLIWQRGFTADSQGGHRIVLWARHGKSDSTPSGSTVRGWWLYLGGPPFIGNQLNNTDIHRDDGVNGFCFVYLREGHEPGSLDDEDEDQNGNAAFWPFEYEQGLDNNDIAPIDGGKYCGWIFFAMTCSPVSNGEVTLGMWAGLIDQDNLVHLGNIVKPELRRSMWTPPDEDPAGPHTMPTTNIAIGTTFAHAAVDGTHIEDPLADSDGDFVKHDEMRIYSRALSDAEVRGLYNHPGGQKRTENLIEPLRQVFVP